MSGFRLRHPGSMWVGNLPLFHLQDRRPRAARPIEQADYQGWWTYSNSISGFSLGLPIGDWTPHQVVAT